MRRSAEENKFREVQPGFKKNNTKTKKHTNEMIASVGKAGKRRGRMGKERGGVEGQGREEERKAGTRIPPAGFKP